MATVTCLCPPRADGAPRHPDGDEITMRERLGFEAATAIRTDATLAAQRGWSEGEINGLCLRAYVLHGVESWTLVDARNQPVPVSRAAILEHVLSSDSDAARLLAGEVDERYTGHVFAPLVAAASISSERGPAAASTSATTGSPSPTPSSRSSTTTTPTDATGTITPLPAGGSRSSRKSGTAA